MAATVGKVVFVGEEQKEQSRLQGVLPKNLIARLPVQVRLTDGVPEAAHVDSHGSARRGRAAWLDSAAARVWILMSPFNFSYVSISQLTI
jgi:hypothetical protein